MKIKKLDDKPMVIHTKEKAKIHAHEPKGAKIKGSNIYTVERGSKVHDAKANESVIRRMRSLQRTIPQSEYRGSMEFISVPHSQPRISRHTRGSMAHRKR